MTRRKNVIIGGMLLVLSESAPAFAHEKWFVDDTRMPLRWDLFAQPQPCTLTLFVAFLILVATVVWRWRGRRDLIPGPEAFGALPERRMAFYGLIPALLAIHLAVPLLVMGVTGRLFSPNNVLRPGYSHFLGVTEVLIALCLFYGTLTRFAAAALALLWGIGGVVVGWEPMLENIHYLGFAGFFFLAGRGPIAVDRLLFPKFDPSASWMPAAPAALRIGVGLSLAIVGFTEKLANLPLAERFLRQYPFINFTPHLGVAMSDDLFALCAGAVEVLAGVLIALGVFPRVIVLIVLFPINLSLTVFNWPELVGHLPFYGSFAFLLIWTPRDRDLWVAGLRQGPLSIVEAGGLRDDRPDRM